MSVCFACRFTCSPAPFCSLILTFRLVIALLLQGRGPFTEEELKLFDELVTVYKKDGEESNDWAGMAAEWSNRVKSRQYNNIFVRTRRQLSDHQRSKNRRVKRSEKSNEIDVLTSIYPTAAPPAPSSAVRQVGDSRTWVAELVGDANRKGERMDAGPILGLMDVLAAQVAFNHVSFVETASSAFVLLFLLYSLSFSHQYFLYPSPSLPLRPTHMW